MQHERLIEKMVSRLQSDLGDRLSSVVLYGPGARGDQYSEVGRVNLMIVLADLEPATLVRCSDAVLWWLKKDQPWPRLFSPELIRDALDVFPIEFLDIARHRHVLVGNDPLADIEVPLEQLRLQCERELREKLMRLREGYVEAHGRSRPLRQLLAASYPSFVILFRGCLHLLGVTVPTPDANVAATLCQRLELDLAPFEAVARIAGGDDGEGDLEDLFERYYRELTRVVARVDQLVGPREGGER